MLMCMRIRMHAAACMHGGGLEAKVMHRFKGVAASGSNEQGDEREEGRSSMLKGGQEGEKRRKVGDLQATQGSQPTADHQWRRHAERHESA